MQTKNEIVAEVERLWVAYRENTAAMRLKYPAPRVLEAVAAAHGITLEELHSVQRRRAYCIARHHAAWELRRRRHDLGLLQVAHHLGRTDHTTALHSYQTFAKLVSQGKYKAEREAVEAALCSSS
jgi:chromosomal replication initiation ATPase DnaA